MSKICPNCGYAASSSHKFCYRCGYDLRILPESGLRQKFFKFSGRLSPAQFWLRMFFLCAANYFFVFAVKYLPLSQKATHTVLSALTFALIISMTTLIVRRSHDLGRPWYFFFVPVILIAVASIKIPYTPAIAMLLWLYISLCPGDKGENKYGVNPPSRTGVIFAAEKKILFAAAIMIAVAWSVTKAQEDEFFPRKNFNPIFRELAENVKFFAEDKLEDLFKQKSPPENIPPQQKPQVITLTKPLTNDNQKAAVDALVSFHRDITQKNYRAAYNRLSFSFQNEMTYEGWIPGFNTTVSSSADQIGVESESSEKIVLSYILTAVDNINGRKEITRFKGTVTVINEGGAWKIDAIKNTEL